MLAFQPGELYHLYNRGNNREPIFFQPDNQRYFLGKMRQYVLPHFHLLAWCLMRNHFHWLVAGRETLDPARCRADLGRLLSSYTRGVQGQQGRTGSLFQKHTQAKHLATPAYALACFCYIQQNPLRAGLVRQPEEWVWSSFLDLTGQRAGTLCDQPAARQLLDLPTDPAALRTLILQTLPTDTPQLLY